MQDHHQTAHYPEARFHQILLALGVMLVLGLYAISDRFILVPPQTAVPRAHTVA